MGEAPAGEDRGRRAGQKQDECWRQRCGYVAAYGLRAVGARHPSALPLLFTRPAVSPAAMGIVDVVYQALLVAGDLVERLGRPAQPHT